MFSTASKRATGTLKKEMREKHSHHTTYGMREHSSEPHHQKEGLVIDKRRKIANSDFITEISKSLRKKRQVTAT